MANWRRLVHALVVASTTLASGVQGAHAAGEIWPAHVEAVYDLALDGVGVGVYNFTASQDGRAYSLAGTAKLNLFLGAIHATGNVTASGVVAGASAKPQAYALNYVSQSKAGATRMAFADDSVAQVSRDPPLKIKPDTVPVTSDHLKGVLDPLSAILAISAGGEGQPCNRRIPIYDGAQRYDLLLSAKGHVVLHDRQPGGPSSIGTVCRVRYMPIAGYRPDDMTTYMTHNTGIELVLRHVPEANIYVPHAVTVPTIAGPATSKLRRLVLTTSTRQQIALQP